MGRKSDNTSGGWTPDHEVDARLSAIRSIYALLIAAKREPGQSVLMRCPGEVTDEIARLARSEGFSCLVTSTAGGGDDRAVSVRWMGGQKTVGETPAPQGQPEKHP